MHRVVFEERYTFIPPRHGRVVARLIMAAFPRVLRKRYGVYSVRVEGAAKVRASIRAGHGVLLAANHCRPHDPFVLGRLFKEAKTLVYGMVSWHIFKRSAWDAFCLRRLGCFSIYREGVDRASMVMAIATLKEARRPLALFPEGVVTRSNDRLEGLMKGTGFIARQAASMRAKEDGGKVVIHPVAIRYVFEDDAPAAIGRACDDLEKLLELSSGAGLDWRGRVARLMVRLLEVMETKHLGEKRSDQNAGPAGNSTPGVDDAWHDRKDALIDAMLTDHEREYLGGAQGGDAVSRVKMLRASILPAMIAKKVDAPERKRRWTQLTDAYYAQELSHFHRGYLGDDAPVERWIEMVERIEELLTDEARVMGRWRAVVRVGDAIEVPTKRARDSDGQDGLMIELKENLQGMLDALRGER